MGVKVNISAGACLMGAGMLMLLPFRWCMGAAIAASVHELSHLVVLWLAGGQALGIQISCAGAKIEMLPMTSGREVLCAAAGPAGSLAFAMLMEHYPEACICAGIQGAYNLLPVFPLDGGRIVNSLLPEGVFAGIEAFTLIMLSGVGLWCVVNLKLGFLPLLPAILVVMQRFPGKFPCKVPPIAVQ